VEQLIDITGVEVIGDYRLRLTFEDGTVGDVDFSGREWRGVFEPLRNPDYFARVTVTSPAAPEPRAEQNPRAVAPVPRSAAVAPG
jgi:hypothetical protein